VLTFLLRTRRGNLLGAAGVLLMSYLASAFMHAAPVTQARFQPTYLGAGAAALGAPEATRQLQPSRTSEDVPVRPFDRINSATDRVGI
jgi:hypothetical protein